jgi:hypothetical protein
LEQKDLVGGASQEAVTRSDDFIPKAIEVLLFGEPGLRRYDDSLSACARVFASENGDTAPSDTRELSDLILDFRREEMAAGPDNHVLRAAGDIQLSRVDKAQVARAQPGARV